MTRKTILLTSTILAMGIIVHTNPSRAASDADIKALESRIHSLEDDLALLKRQHEVDDEKAKSAAEKNATVEMGKKGLKVTSPDKNYELSIKGYVQIDSRLFIDDKADTGRNDILARRIRPVIEGRAGKASMRIMPDFAGATPRIYDAHVDYKLYDELQFRAGKFKPPIGLERLQSATDTFFVERGHPTNLVPNRDLGVQVYGNLFSGIAEYQLGAFDGTFDLGNADGDSDDKKDVAARIFAQPLRNSSVVALQGLGLGVGGSRGNHVGSVGTPILGDYRTPGQQTFFRYRSGATAAFADGTQWRLAPQAYWYYRNFGLLGEYVVSSQEVTRTVNHATLANKAWQLAGSYVLTGEDVNFKGSVKPEHDFDLQGVGWGAFEVVGRVGQTDIDDDAFPIYADPVASASKARSYGGGLNWYPSENFKLQVDYDQTVFDGGAPGGEDRPDEKALLSRAQFRF